MARETMAIRNQRVRFVVRASRGENNVLALFEELEATLPATLGLAADLQVLSTGVEFDLVGYS